MEVHNAEVIRNRKIEKLKNRFIKVVIFLISAILMSGVFQFCQYLTEMVHDQEEAVFFSGAAGGYIVLIICLIFSGLFVALILFTVKYHIEQKSYSKIKQSLKLQILAFGIFFFFMLPFLVLGFDHYVVITEKDVHYSRFWTLGKKEYHWKEDVFYISLHYFTTPTSSRSSGGVNYQYFIHFADGHRVDVWENMWYGSIEHIKFIDEVAQQHQIPFKVESRPSDQGLEVDFEGEYIEFAKELFSR